MEGRKRREQWRKKGKEEELRDVNSNLNLRSGSGLEYELEKKELM